MPMTASAQKTEAITTITMCRAACKESFRNKTSDSLQFVRNGQCFSTEFCRFDMNLVFKYTLIIFINLLCYYSSLSGDFVFDDSVAILKNRDVSEKFNGETVRVSLMNENHCFTAIYFDELIK